MSLEALQEALAGLKYEPTVLITARRLSRDLRTTGRTIVSDPAQALAYALTRMPATAAAVSAALGWARERQSGAWTRLLDLGSGTGAALWAAAGHLNLQRLTALEPSPELAALGRRLAAGYGPLSAVTWLSGSMTSPLPAGHDLLIASYSLGELPEHLRGPAVLAAWAATDDALLIVEPGTPAGAAVVAQARHTLLAAGAPIVGPCTHSGPCPLARTNAAPGLPGWCHARVRLPRSRIHRLAKAARRGFEDECVSWLCCARSAAPPHGWRILDRPRLNKVGWQAPVCGPTGAQVVQITRRQGDMSLLRRLDGGDWWPGSW